MTRLMSNCARKNAGWLATIPTACRRSRAKADHHIFSIVLLHFKKYRVFGNMLDHILHVVRMIGFRWTAYPGGIRAIAGIGAGLARRLFQIVGRHKLNSSRSSRGLGIVFAAKAHADVSLWSSPAELSFVTSSCVTSRITSGPVINIYDVCSTIKEICNGGRIDCPYQHTAPSLPRSAHNPAVERVTQKNIA